MKKLTLRGIVSDAVLIFKRSVHTPSPQVEAAWNLGYRKLSPAADVPPGTARVFETGGIQLLIVNDDGEFHVLDASALNSKVATGERIEALLEQHAGSDAEQVAAFDVLIEQEWIWANIDRTTSKT